LINADLQNKLEPVLISAGQRIRQEIKTVFSVKPQGKRDGEGEGWKRTSIMAMRLRKTFPRARGKRGADGLTEEQRRYIYSAPTLVDTGALRDSINVTQVTRTAKSITVYIQDNKSYGGIHEKGGTTVINGRNIIIPKRSFLFLTNMDIKRIEAIIEAKTHNE